MPLYAPAEKVASAGIHLTVATSLCCFLAMFPLCLILSLIQDPFLKKTYQCFFGLFMSFYMWGFAFSYQLVMGLTVFLVMATVPSRKLAYLLGHLVGVLFLV